MIIVLHGKARSGKDTFFDTIKYASYVEKVAFAAPMKDIACTFFNIDHQALEETKDQHHHYGCTPRHFLQRLGDIGKELCGPDLWSNIAIDTIKQKKSHHVCVTDCRFLNELQILKDNFSNIVCIKIKRGEEDIIQESAHSSENGLPDHLFDYVLENNGTLEEYRAIVLHLFNYVRP